MHCNCSDLIWLENSWPCWSPNLCSCPQKGRKDPPTCGLKLEARTAIVEVHKEHGAPTPEAESVALPVELLVLLLKTLSSLTKCFVQALETIHKRSSTDGVKVSKGTCKSNEEGLKSPK